MGAACGSGTQRVAPGRVVARWLAPGRVVARWLAPERVVVRWLAPERLAPGCSAGTEVRR